MMTLDNFQLILFIGASFSLIGTLLIHHVLNEKMKIADKNFSTSAKSFFFNLFTVVLVLAFFCLAFIEMSLLLTKYLSESEYVAVALAASPILLFFVNPISMIFVPLIGTMIGLALGSNDPVVITLEISSILFFSMAIIWAIYNTRRSHSKPSVANKKFNRPALFPMAACSIVILFSLTTICTQNASMLVLAFQDLTQSSPPTPEATPKPTAVTKKSLSERKLQEVAELQLKLTAKVNTLQKTHEALVEQIEQNVAEIKVQKELSQSAEFLTLIKDKRVKNCLLAIQKAKAYDDNIAAEIEKSINAKDDLTGITKQLTLDIKLLNALESEEQVELIKQLDLVIDKIQPEALTLVLPDSESYKLPLEEIYNKFCKN